jgi:hypothetical protein
MEATDIPLGTQSRVITNANVRLGGTRWELPADLSEANERIEFQAARLISGGNFILNRALNPSGGLCGLAQDRAN